MRYSRYTEIQKIQKTFTKVCATRNALHCLKNRHFFRAIFWRHFEPRFAPLFPTAPRLAFNPNLE